MANTVIFKWNPAISSYGMCALLDDIINHTLGGNWSVGDYENVRKGDTFFMLKVRKGQNGVVMRGKITSDPYVDEDWSGQGRKVYYCDFLADIIINPDTFFFA